MHARLSAALGASRSITACNVDAIGEDIGVDNLALIAVIFILAVLGVDVGPDRASEAWALDCT